MVFQELLSQAFIIALLASAVRLAMPLLIAGLGEIFTERSGILNIGIEGAMLFGGLGGFLGSYYTGSPWLGLLSGMLAGAMMSSIHAFLTINLAVDQVVSGIAVNLLSTGVSIFLYRAIFGISTSLPSANGFDVVEIPFLSKIPILGPILFQHQILVYLGLGLVLLASIVLNRTTFGLRVTAVGEDPHAAETMGINVYAHRWACEVIGGLAAGMAGTFLALGQLTTWQETIVAGRGFIAVAVVMFGRWNPVGALGASLLFGLADAFQLHLQAFSFTSIPPQLLRGLPYLVTILVMLTGVGKAAVPSALCVPFTRED
jgi:simple sugar transport system permease protein